MKTLTFDSREAWLEARRGKITGTRVKDVITKRGNGIKMGVYEVIAERLSVPVEFMEDPMERGSRLEPEAIELFSKATGKKVDTSLVIWTRDDNDSIAVSPDAFVVPKKKGIITEAVEAKCLSSAQHVKAFFTKEIPDEYQDQSVEYFVVNENLKTLYFVFLDPRIAAKEFFYLEIKREDVQEKADQYLLEMTDKLKYVEECVSSLNF